MNRSQVLSHLQAFDIQTTSNRQLLREVQARLTDESRLTAAQTQLTSVQTTDGELRARLRDAELSAKTLDEKLRGVSQRLYGGKVSNAKELTGLEQDEQMLKRQRSELDDQMLDLMVRVEAIEKQVREWQAQFDQTTAERTREVEKFRREVTELEKQSAELERQRETLRVKISSEDLCVYDELTHTHKGHATATIKGVACSECRVDVPSGLKSRAQAGEELVYCPNCGRILVA